MKMKKKSTKRNNEKRHVVLTDRELSTIHAGKAAKKLKKIAGPETSIGSSGLDG